MRLIILDGFLLRACNISLYDQILFFISVTIPSG